MDVRVLGSGSASGIEEYTSNLLDNILNNNRDHEISLFYSGLKKRRLDYQVPIIDVLAPNKFIDLASRFSSWSPIDKKADVDVVFSPHFNILNTASPRVITFHDLSFLHHPYFFSAKQKVWHWLQDYRRQARQASKIIAVSEFTKSDLINFLDVDPKKISVVYSGINQDFKKLPVDNHPLIEFKKRHNLNRPFFLYLGTLEPRKNVVGLIKAFDILKSNPTYKDFQLILAGKRGWLYRDIIKTFNNSSHKKDIVFWGPVKTVDRIFLYNLAMAFVYPSFFEGFGFPPLEAQACGCPVITADRTSLPEVIGSSGILIDPWRIADLASAMAQINDKTSLRQEIVQKGIKNSQRFNWTAAAKKTLNILANV
ncbi:MAG: glycosyltransferase family 1 protein [bacterium]|nr:glycosyltransferase family 1 protein [bacterium]